MTHVFKGGNREKTFLDIVNLIVSILTVGFSGAMAQTPQGVQIAKLTAPVGAGITYQGYLEDANSPLSDNCDFQFSVYGSVCGTDVFQGDEHYVEISVRCPSGSGAYSPLSPRQPMTPAPYALTLPGLYTTPRDEGSNIIGGYADFPLLLQAEVIP